MSGRAGVGPSSSPAGRGGLLPLEDDDLPQVRQLPAGHHDALPGDRGGTARWARAVRVAGLARQMDGALTASTSMGDGEPQEGWCGRRSCSPATTSSTTSAPLSTERSADRSQVEGWGWSPGDKWRAFRWNPIVVDGHDLAQLIAAYETAAQHAGQPTVILAKTVKGKGVSFMENQVGWHGIAPSVAQGRQALRELAASEGCLIRGMP